MVLRELIKNASLGTTGEGYCEHDDLELNSLYGQVCKKTTKKNVIAQPTGMKSTLDLSET